MEYKKVFLLTHKVTGEKQKVVAKTPEDACEKMDWRIGETKIREEENARTDRRI